MTKNSPISPALIVSIIFASTLLSVSIMFFVMAFTGGIVSQEKIIDGIEEYAAQLQAEQIAAAEAANQPRYVDNVSEDDDPFIGDENAPVVIVEFSDFECPFCKTFFDESYAQIKSDYIDKGLVKLVYRDFPLDFHPSAIPAAIAANCALEQGGNQAYFKYHDLLFANQNGPFSNDQLKQYATELGLNQVSFNTCFDEERYKDEIMADQAEGRSYGVSGTPGFFVNGLEISGAQPYSTFKSAIDNALADAE